MSYQVLARKWRPRAFDELVGQAHVVRALVNALDEDRLHHAFLFTGTRGVGKTTIARILSKCLNCETGVSSRPCGQCAACREIDEGRFVDLIEVDAASRAKVDETRELMDNVQFAPTRGRYKVYLIDEVHMFSGHSFNALLKTLEEPPPHVKFLLATTDPQKLPITVLSRCLQFNLKRLPKEAIANQLTRILAEEGVTAEGEAVRRIAAAADGSMRDGLSLLDQAVAFAGGKVGDAETRAMLGTLDSAHVRALLEHIAAGDAAGLMARVEEMASDVTDFSEALGEVLSVLQRIAVMQAVPDALELEEDEGQALKALAERLSPEDVQLYYQIGVLGRRDLPFVPEPRGGFEMVLLRMLAFRPASAAGHLAPEAKTAGAPSSPAAPPAVARNANEQSWPEIVAGLRVSGVARELAANSVLRAREGDVIHLTLASSYEQLMGNKIQEKLEAALRAYFGTEIKLRVTLGAEESPTPAEIQRGVAEERRQAAVRAVEADPNVRAFRETFDAELDITAVRPVDSSFTRET